MRTDWLVLGSAVLFVLLAVNQGESVPPQPVSIDAAPQFGHDASFPAPIAPAPAPTPTQVAIPPTAHGSGSLQYKGYACVVDCSGHEAGYEWAEENGIDDPDDCDGNSESFIEGCRSYAETQQPTEQTRERDGEEGEDEDRT